MLKILICCGGGFSSSYVTQKMANEVKERHLDDEIYLEFYPFSIMLEKKDDFDIVMCCPHLKISVEKMIKDVNPDIPIYILPPRMYGLMNLDELVTDARDVIEMYQQGQTNPIKFPGEDNVLRVTRKVAYRNQ